MLLDPGTVTHQSIGFSIFLTGYCSILGISSQIFYNFLYFTIFLLSRKAKSFIIILYLVIKEHIPMAGSTFGNIFKITTWGNPTEKESVSL